MLKIIILLDNGSFHKNSTLVIPNNIRLIFLPPYDPELNPIKHFWQEIRCFLKSEVLTCLDDLMNKRFLDQCTPDLF
jgi:transposase